MNFYLGTHDPGWLSRVDIPLFISRRRLMLRKKLPVALAPWALDSGGFTELNLYGKWRTQPSEYVADVNRFAQEIGKLDWVAPQDWMCEPAILAKTRLTVKQHQYNTLANFDSLRYRLGGLVIPVLQGWTRDDYLRHWNIYESSNVNLEREPLVGLGTICRRQDTVEAGRIVRALAPLRLHGFGIKITGLRSFADALVSADSLAWSYRARRAEPLPGCSHKSCANCLRFALDWRQKVLSGLDQLRLCIA